MPRAAERLDAIGEALAGGDQGEDGAAGEDEAPERRAVHQARTGARPGEDSLQRETRCGHGWLPQGLRPALPARTTRTRYSAKWNAAAAIHAAADRLAAGDAILVELHAPGPNSPGTNDEQKGYIAVEYWDAEFAAIAYAVAKGINVVEAAGNGGEDLNAAIYAGRFDRRVRDSGAILVGAGHSARDVNARSRISWSNYGSRLDAQGWGEDIVTCGGLSRPEFHDRYTGLDESHCYMQSFGGTSGATPIVVGAVACLSGAMRARGRAALTPESMRSLIATTEPPRLLLLVQTRARSLVLYQT